MNLPTATSFMFKDKAKFDIQNPIIGSLYNEVLTDKQKEKRLLENINKAPDLKDIEIQKRLDNLKKFEEGINDDDDDDDDDDNKGPRPPAPSNNNLFDPFAKLPDPPDNNVPPSPSGLLPTPPNTPIKKIFIRWWKSSFIETRKNYFFANITKNFSKIR